MPKTRPPYDAEFRQRILELLHSGRTLKSLAEEFGCTEQSIRNWQRQGGRAAPERKEGLSPGLIHSQGLRRPKRERGRALVLEEACPGGHCPLLPQLLIAPLRCRGR